MPGGAPGDAAAGVRRDVDVRFPRIQALAADAESPPRSHAVGDLQNHGRLARRRLRRQGRENSRIAVVETRAVVIHFDRGAVVRAPFGEVPESDGKCVADDAGVQPERGAVERRGVGRHDGPGPGLQEHFHRDETGGIRREHKARMINLAAGDDVAARDESAGTVMTAGSGRGKAAHGRAFQAGDFQNQTAVAVAIKVNVQPIAARAHSRVNRPKPTRIARRKRHRTKEHIERARQSHIVGGSDNDVGFLPRL